MDGSSPFNTARCSVPTAQSPVDERGPRIIWRVHHPRHPDDGCVVCSSHTSTEPSYQPCMDRTIGRWTLTMHTMISWHVDEHRDEPRDVDEHWSFHSFIVLFFVITNAHKYRCRNVEQAATSIFCTFISIHLRAYKPTTCHYHIADQEQPEILCDNWLHLIQQQTHYQTFFLRYRDSVRQQNHYHSTFYQYEPPENLVHRWDEASGGFVLVPSSSV